MFGNLWFEDYVKIGTDIWFAAGNYNGLYKFNTINKEVKRVAAFPGEQITKDWAFRRVKQWNGKLVFMPSYASAVCLFDVVNETFKRIDILDEEEQSEYQTRCNFQSYGIYGDWLYLIGYEYLGIIKVNLKNHQTEKIKNIPSEVLKINGGSCFGTEAVVEGNIIYIVCASSNRVLMLDMSKDSFKVIKVGNDANRYGGIYKVDGAFYLTIYDNDNLIRWEHNSGKCTEIELKFKTHFFDRKMCETRNYIWIFSYVTNEVFKIDKKNQQTSKILLNHLNNVMWLVFCEETSDGIYFLNMYDAEWHILREDGTDENLHFIMKEPDKRSLMQQFLHEKKFRSWKVLAENNVVAMEIFFLKLFDGESNAEEIGVCDNYGKKIYEMIESGKDII